MIIYDLIVIGGGISGLYTNYNYLKQNKDKKTLLLERNSNLGGRINTIKYKSRYIFESGAGRFSEKHKYLISLIKELKLNKKCIKIDNVKEIRLHPKDIYKKHFEKYKNMDNIIKILIKEISKRGKTFQNSIHKYNLLELADILLKDNVSKFMEDIYPYYSELSVMNAYDALELFKSDFNSKTKFYILSGGLYQIIKILETKIKKLKGNIKTDIELKYITKEKELYCVNKLFYCKKIVLAIPKPALNKIIKLKTNNILLPLKKYINTVKGEPLYRIYVKYKTPCWFKDIDKFSTNLPIKFFIPYNKDTGLVMVSYTDGKYARYWFNILKKGEKHFEKEINKQLKLLFPSINIPKYEWMSHHFWDEGVYYWKKGYKGKELEKKIFNCLKKETNENIYLCGECYSSKQAWIEGGLNTSQLVLKNI